MLFLSVYFIIEFCNSQTLSKSYTVNVQPVNQYQQFGGVISRFNDYEWSAYYTFTFSTPCYKPLIRIVEAADLDWIDWAIDGVSQSRIIAPHGCDTSLILEDFKLYEYDLRRYVILTTSIQFWYNVDFGSYCPVYYGIEFYLKCLPAPWVSVSFYPFSLVENYYINITKTSLLQNKYKDYTILINSTQKSQKIYSYFRLLDEACYLPKLSVSASMRSGSVHTRIGVDGAEYWLLPSCLFNDSTNCTMQNCVNTMDITSLLQSDDITNYIEILVQPILTHRSDRIRTRANNTNVTVTANITLSCLLTDFHSVYPPKIEVKEVDMEATDDKFKYHSFTQVLSSFLTEEPLFAVFQMKNQQCVAPKLHIKVNDTDFDGSHEWINLYYLVDVAPYNVSLGTHIQTCNPNDNSCLNQHSCVATYEINQNIIDKLIVKIFPNNNDALCQIGNDSFSMYVNVTLECYALETADEKQFEFELDIRNSTQYNTYSDFVFPIHSNETAQDLRVNIKMMNYPCFFPFLSLNMLDIDFNDEDEFVDIYVDEIHIKTCNPNNNSCLDSFSCIDEYDLTALSNKLSITDFIQIFIDVHENNYNQGNDTECPHDLSFSGDIILHCFIPPNVSDQTNQIVHIDQDGSFNTSLSLSSNSPDGFVGKFNFWFHQSAYKCSRAQIAINTLSTDYNDNDEYLLIKMSFAHQLAFAANCNPNLADCTTSYNCLTSSLGQIEDAVFVTVSSFGAGAGCGLSYHTVVTLQCYNTDSPTKNPTTSPTSSPTPSPTTNKPTFAPSLPTLSPTSSPTMPPTSPPTEQPSNPTTNPSPAPTYSPTFAPTYYGAKTSCGNHMFCYNIVVQPIIGQQSAFPILIRDTSGYTETEFFINFNVTQNDCEEPMISFEFEQIDYDSSNEYVSIYKNDGSLLQKCDGGQNQCGIWKQCLNQYKLDISKIEVNNYYQIKVLKPYYVTAQCVNHQYSINANLVLYCKSISKSPTTHSPILPTTRLPSNSPTPPTTPRPTLTLKPTNNPLTASICDRQCESEENELEIELVFELFDGLYYDFRNIECFMFELFYSYLPNYAFSSFDVCDLTVDAVNGGINSYNSPNCLQPPCLWLEESHQRLLLDDFVELSVQITVYDENALSSLSTNNLIQAVDDKFEENFNISVSASVNTRVLIVTAYSESDKLSVTETPVFMVSLFLALSVLAWATWHFCFSTIEDHKECGGGNLGAIVQGIKYNKNALERIFAFALFAYELIDCILDFITMIGIFVTASKPDNDYSSLYYKCGAASLFAVIAGGLLFYGKFKLYKMYYNAINVWRDKKGEIELEMEKRKKHKDTSKYKSLWRDYYNKYQHRIGQYLGHLISYDLFGVALEDCVQLTVTWYISSDAFLTYQSGFTTYWLWIKFTLSVLSISFKLFRAFMLKMRCHHDNIDFNLKPEGDEFINYEDLSFFQQLTKSELSTRALYSTALNMVQRQPKYEKITHHKPKQLRISNDMKEEEIELVNNVSDNQHVQPSDSTDDEKKEIVLSASNDMDATENESLSEEENKFDEQLQLSKEVTNYDVFLTKLKALDSKYVEMQQNEWEPVVDEIYNISMQIVLKWALKQLKSDNLIRKQLQIKSEQDIANKTRPQRKKDLKQEGIAISFDENKFTAQQIYELQYLYLEKIKTMNAAEDSYTDWDEKKDENKQSDYKENKLSQWIHSKGMKSQTKNQSSDMQRRNSFSLELQCLDTKYEEIQKKREWQSDVRAYQDQYKQYVLNWAIKELQSDEVKRNELMNEGINFVAKKENKKMKKQLSQRGIVIDNKKLKLNIQQQYKYCTQILQKLKDEQELNSSSEQGTESGNFFNTSKISEWLKSNKNNKD